MAHILDALYKQIDQEQDRLTHHPVFGALQNLDDVRMFMQWHVFAVWDFMSLAKRLQKDFTCIDIPWSPSPNSRICRVINEIILSEESDLDINQSDYISHFALYLNAMKDIKANTKQINCFVEAVNQTQDIDEALKLAYVPDSIGDFVKSTMDTALNQSSYEALGSFFYGRENIIPPMFQTLLDQWQVDPKQVPAFHYYIKRHIDLDGQDHGPMVLSIIDELLKDDPINKLRLLSSGLHAIKKRIQFWDALYLSQFSTDWETFGLNHG